MNNEQNGRRSSWELRVSVWTLATWGGLLILGQLLISEWTIKASSNEQVVNYVSFAGTLIGIVLAILAIIYAFISSISQKDDANSLRFEIGKLNSAIDKASVSGNLFSEQVEGLKEIRTSLAEVIANSELSRQSVERNTQALQDLVKRQESERADQEAKLGSVSLDSKSSVGKDSSNYRAAVQRMVGMALSYQIVQYYLAIAFNDMGKPNSNYWELERSLFIHALKDPDNAEVRMSSRSQIHAYWLVFSDFGVFTDPDVLRVLQEGLLEQANKGPISVAHPDYSLTGMKDAFSLIASRLTEALAP